MYLDTLEIARGAAYESTKFDRILSDLLREIGKTHAEAGGKGPGHTAMGARLRELPTLLLVPALSLAVWEKKHVRTRKARGLDSSISVRLYSSNGNRKALCSHRTWIIQILPRIFSIFRPFS